MHVKVIQPKTDTGAQTLADTAAPAPLAGDERRNGERRRPRSSEPEGDNLFRGLLRFSSDWYWEQDENFRFTANLRGFVEHPGVRARSYVGKTRWEVATFGVTEEQWAAHKALLSAHQPFYEFEYLRPSSDDVCRWVSVSGEPVFDVHGRFRGYRGVGKDITERKQAQQRQAIEYAVAHILSNATGMGDAIPEVIRAVCETMGWDYGGRWEYAENDGYYSCAELWFRPWLSDSEFIGWHSGKRVLPNQRGLVRRVLATGEPHWVLDIAAEPEMKCGPAALRSGLSSAFAFPIATGSRTLGAMEFFARRIWQPDLALTDTARSVGRQIGQFMERKQAEERYRELVELSPNAILVHCEGRIVFANSATASLLGVTQPAELYGRSVYDFVHPDQREFARSRVALILEQRRALGTSEMKSVGLDGSVRDMEVSSSYFVFEGRPAVQAIARDISERKAADQKILRLSKLYAALSQTNQAITRLIDPQALFEEVCRIAVEHGEFGLVAIVMIDPQTRWVRSLAEAGPQRDYVHRVRLSIDPDLPEGRGLVGTALRSGQHVICNDVMQDERTLPFREALGATKLNAVAIIPLSRNGSVFGGLILSAAEAGYFDAQLIELLVEMASNISFALDAIDKETQRREAEERFAQLAQYDVLTGLPNRNLFRDRLLQAMARARRSGALVGLMFFDLDRFKQINDTLGHGTGDRVLQEVAARLKEHLREVDTISRLGGDEFTLIVEGATDSARLAMVAQKVHETLAAPIRIDGREIFVSTSIGITVYPRDATDVDDLVRNADLAMYRAKREGRNAYLFHTPEMSVHAAERLYIEEGLHRALEQKELVLHYQPTVEAKTGRILGMEALLRWNSPGGLVGPRELIPVAEETGLIVDIGHWVLECACTQAAQWQRQGLGPLLLRINVSARQFMERDLFQSIATALSRSRLPASSLGLEITESMLVDQTSGVSEVLAKLVQLGVRLAIDDFGTGYSSLTYLKRFPLHDIKIDQSFVREITSNPDDAAIVRAIVAMARSLDIGVTAEGVETQAQLELLQNLGCDAYQGYLFSVPLPPDAFEQLVCAQRR